MPALHRSLLFIRPRISPNVTENSISSKGFYVSGCWSLLYNTKETQKLTIIDILEEKEEGIFFYLDLLWVFSFSNPHHPQKLVDVIARVTYHASEYHQNVVNVEHLHDLIR